MRWVLTALYAFGIFRCMEHLERIWPSSAALKADLDAVKGADVPYQTVAAWKRRGRVPAEYDLDLIEAAKRRGETLTLEDLALARRSQTSRGRE